jgi:hypothetical protein
MKISLAWVLMIAVIVSGAILLAPVNFPVGLATWITVDLIVITLFFIWLTRSYGPFGFQCGVCGHKFKVTTLRFLRSPSIGTGREVKKYTTCPSCKKRVPVIPLKKWTN